MENVHLNHKSVLLSWLFTRADPSSRSRRNESQEFDIQPIDSRAHSRGARRVHDARPRRGGAPNASAVTRHYPHLDAPPPRRRAMRPLER